MSIQQIVLASRPKGMPDANTFRIDDVSLPALQAGDVRVEPTYFSVDPYMRGRMNDAKSYIPPFKVEQPLTGGAVGKVLESKADSFAVGDLVTGNLPWATQAVVAANGLKKIDASLAPASYYLGILGMPGLTAYFGLLDIGNPQPGETVVVSGAAGAVGIIVGQIAKIKGCRVVGIAGSDDKVALLKEEFGFDEVVNYKTATNLTEAIADACPNGVDVYFDNVGGEVSDAVINNINFHARIPLCGQIALYNTTEVPMGPRIQPMLLTRSVLMKGFVIGNYQARFGEGAKQLAAWVNEGKLRYTETTLKGFDKLPEAMLGLFSGQNTGKMIVEV
ncbi:NADP-dependent oxidoreductase [Spirosoma linguale]|uniref:Alcohol dehydrogenase zinc-binding domain protein n=1 Tax=Spirosoma linguale (strain ATCC 33905 / DSM 74 / LMG 10896 / Claus 1) TaxID=504472 RepID=D2QM87_SPILD|nr:Alcohol dehydrogenase zinc-binding domain protein [Spirosoma linguale DSM 74]